MALSRRGRGRDGPRRKPRPQSRLEHVVGERLAPEGAVGHARLRQRPVHVEHADEAGPGAAPVGDGQDRGAVRRQAVEDVVRILPRGKGHHQRLLRVDLPEDRAPVLLAVDEAVFFLRIVRMAARHPVALGLDGLRDGSLDLGLLRPALPIGRQPQVAVGNQGDGFFAHGG